MSTGTNPTGARKAFLPRFHALSHEIGAEGWFFEAGLQDTMYPLALRRPGILATIVAAARLCHRHRTAAATAADVLCPEIIRRVSINNII